MRMRDYIKGAQDAVLAYEDGDPPITTAEFLAPCGIERIREIEQEGNPMIFVGKMYDVVRRVEAAAHKHRITRKRRWQNFLPKLLSRKEEDEIVMIAPKAATLKHLLIPLIETLETKIETQAVRDLRLGGLTVDPDLEDSYSNLLERAELSNEFLLEKLTWAKRVLTESLPVWGY